MSNSSGLGLALVAAGAIASVPATAGPVTVSHAVTLNTLMQGNSSTLDFNLNAFLASEGFNATEVVGGSVSVFGFSEASYGAAQYGSDYNTSSYASGSHTGYYAYYVQGYQSCGWWGGCYYSGGYTAWAAYSITDYTQRSDRDIRHVDAVADQMTLTVGSSSSTATANTTSSSAGPFGGDIYDGNTASNCYNGNCSYTNVYHRERDVYSAIYGNLQTSLVLDAGALADLSSDGILGLGFGAPVGQFRLNAVSFDLVVQHQAAQAQNKLQAAEVPEPQGLPLTALALAAALAAGRYRWRAKR